MDPLSVEEIVQRAGNFDYNSLVPLRYWLRSADTIQKEASIYEHEGNDQQAYLLLFRHATLILDKLSRHPEAKDPANKTALQEARQIVQRNLQKLEELRPKINRRHERYMELRARQEAERKKMAGARQTISGPVELTREMDRLSVGTRRSTDPAGVNTKQSLDAGEHRDLAAKLAQREIRRRDLAKRKVRQAGVSDEEEHERRTAGVWNTWEDDLAGNGMKEESDDLNRRIIEVGRRGQDALDRRRESVASEGRSMATGAYHYPMVPQKHDFQTWETTAIKAAQYPDTRPPGAPPAIPRKVLLDPAAGGPVPPPYPRKAPIRTEPSGPPLPGKYLDSDGSETPSRSASATPPRPELNSSDYQFKPTAFLENGAPLRTVFIPPTLRQEFLRVAWPNTRQNLETCGILCGTLISNALFISRLLIPEQENTSDTCETTNESALFDYCDSEDLMVLGWIHTHPSQTCFMSSRDLHTHCGYQVMMPESIAIVCAPSKQPSWGCFRLTDPPGMKSILNCTQTGLFHPHAEINIYTDAKKPGHVCELPGLEFAVVDQRPS
ncbi:endosome-associated ubiquitin isopeptidase [Phyllosticta citricarpa]|uniref:Endosome-associated ubiquitin isopeptidase n=2 Tax=Phyllosticta TaxID=121621 RepID=A0ABR1LIN2_9PEZI